MCRGDTVGGGGAVSGFDFTSRDGVGADWADPDDMRARNYCPGELNDGGLAKENPRPFGRGLFYAKI